MLKNRSRRETRKRLRAIALATAITAIAGLMITAPVTAITPAAHAQSTSEPSTTSTISRTTSDVKNWTRRKWSQMKREWARDKAKWDACNQMAADQKLSGRASWSFLYDCMRKPS